MKYTLTSVDWNPEQTKVWLHHARKNCPTANIVLVPDSKPIPDCWSCGKLECFNQDFETENILYLDTDTIITHDLKEVFYIMEDSRKSIGLSPWSNFQGLTRYSKQGPLRSRHKSKKFINGFSYSQYRHYSSGMIATIECHKQFYEAWMTFCKIMKRNKEFSRHKLFEEIALSLLVCSLKSNSVWNIPAEIHNNILNKHTTINPFPWVIHYHKPERLKRCKLERYLKSE